MPYVPDVINDVFISYARVDDAAATDQQGWVSRFFADLERVLKCHVGLGTNEELRIFFDRRDLSSNDHLDVLKENARRSAAFVAIISPSYVKRDWTREELAAFRDNGHSAGRVFAVENLPLDNSETYPEPFHSLARKAFWAQEEHSGTAVPLSHDDRRWKARIHDVAKEIKFLLHKLRAAGGIKQAISGRIPLTPQISTDPKRTVLLAQVTDDLDEDREQVRRYLEQYGIATMPNGTYPQGGPDFIRAFEADLGKANFFVQLVGNTRSRHPPDLPQGYAQCQYEAAKREESRRPQEFVLLVWRRPDLDPADVSHDDKKLLSVPEVRAMGLEAFKAEILRQVEQASAPKKRQPEPAAGLRVFVDADKEDLELARSVQTDFVRNGCTALLRLYDGEARKLRDDLEKKIIWCDALAVIFGVAQPQWISSQAMKYSHLTPRRSKPARMFLICRDPARPKKEHGVAMPELREIDYVPGALHDPIKDLVSELRQ